MLEFILDAVEVVAALVWAGGMLVLGALVAPTVFHSGDPRAADLMAAVFVRFDYVAVAAALAILAAESAALFLRPRFAGRVRVARVGLAALLGLCVLVQAAYLSPAIVGLHARGVRRGVGALGAEFDRAHHLSEAVGKLTVAAAVALAVAVLHSRASAPRAAWRR